MASVTRAKRPGADAATQRSTSGCRCTPSEMASTTTLGSSVSANTGPGSRWCTGRIALNRCVPTVTPASIASREVSK